MLRHPRDLVAWQHWQEARSPLRRLAHRVRPEPPLTGVLTLLGERPRTLVVLDSDLNQRFTDSTRLLNYGLNFYQ